MKSGKNLKVKNAIEKAGIENIEVKENVKFRINKSDVVILTDAKKDLEEYKKINNLILITTTNEEKEILNYCENLRVMDILYDDLKNHEYIGKRIAKLLLAK